MMATAEGFDLYTCEVCFDKMLDKDPRMKMEEMKMDTYGTLGALPAPQMAFSWQISQTTVSASSHSKGNFLNTS